MTSATIPQDMTGSADIIPFPRNRIVRSLKERQELRRCFREVTRGKRGDEAWRHAQVLFAIRQHIAVAPDLEDGDTPRERA